MSIFANAVVRGLQEGAVKSVRVDGCLLKFRLLADKWGMLFGF